MAKPLLYLLKRICTTVALRNVKAEAEAEAEAPKALAFWWKRKRLKISFV
jgi:hypothetical protein